MSSKVRPQESTNQLSKVVGAALVLALLYFGRDVLIPIVLAILLSLLVAPMVRGLKRFGMGQTGSVATCVLVLTLGLLTTGSLITSQLIRMGSSLPQYENTIRHKLTMLDQITLGKLSAITEHSDRVLKQLSSSQKANHLPTTTEAFPTSAELTTPVPVELREPAPSPVQILTRIATSVWGPIETSGIVFIVLVFVLLEHEALRDRFIRLIGKNNLRATTVAVNDAGNRLSRFFVSQFAVNLLVGALICVGLAIIGVPQALLWGVLTASLRFVPYVGAWIAAACATLLAAAISPDWTLAILSLTWFGFVELIISQFVEPRLYGHATGLSPLSVVISAIFWSWIWGPVGLILSTPLTLCLLVAGRYVDALKFLEILLGEIPALTVPENFYQRALAGDAHEITASAKRFLKRRSFSSYCDVVLTPALYLAQTDFMEKSITREEELKVTNAVTSLLISLEENRKWWKGNSSVTLLEGVNAARHLRAKRERDFGQWQGPLNVPAGSIILTIGLGSVTNEFAAEILVRVLRAQNLDGRHLSLEDLEAPPPPESTPELVSVVCFVSMDARKEQDLLETSIGKIRQRMPHAKVLTLCLKNPFEELNQIAQPILSGHLTLHSYEETVQACIANLRTHRTAGGV
ncbi:AI-2E family transporter [Undibacterium sp.]|uniref:AI-2E family transporter n=1 Tax=Undibacterium sp. TaxID=1914977 RepID=UPI002CEC6DB2|nr:AI-2E family transporter [Undibacterium sp.]HTD02616.1 AI-2E family transporter [Undibacterium sp.]